MHLKYPLKLTKHTRRILYTQRHYLSGEGQERLFMTRKRKTIRRNETHIPTVFDNPVINTSIYSPMPTDSTSSCTGTVSPLSCTLDCTLVFVCGTHVSCVWYGYAHVWCSVVWCTCGAHVVQCGQVVRALALRSGDPGFKTRSDHSLNLILVVPGSTSLSHS